LKTGSLTKKLERRDNRIRSRMGASCRSNVRLLCNKKRYQDITQRQAVDLQVTTGIAIYV